MPRQARLDAPGNSGGTILISSLQDGTPCTIRKPAPVGSLESLYFSNQRDAPGAHRRVFDSASRAVLSTRQVLFVITCRRIASHAQGERKGGANEGHIGGAHGP